MTEHHRRRVLRGGMGLIAPGPGSARAADQAPGRQLPRHIDAAADPRPAPTPSTPRPTATASAAPWKRCWWTRSRPSILPSLAADFAERGVELRGCPRTLALLPHLKPATKRLGHPRVPGPGPGGAHRRHAGRCHRTHRPLGFRPHRRHRHRGPVRGPALPARGRFQLGLREPAHLLRRRLRVRAGRRDRHFDQPPARARPGRTGRPDHAEMGAQRRRPVARG